MAILYEFYLFNTFGRFVRMYKAKKYIVCLVLFMVPVCHVLAQHYFFIEAERGQPFYVKKADTLFSSNAIGFIIISRNYQSELTFSIGFPQNKYPEIIFNMKDMDHDRGFQLKKLDQKGWVLFDRGSFEIFEPNQSLEIKKQEIVVPVKKSADEFGRMLAEVTDDYTLLEIPAVPVTAMVKPANEITNLQKRTSVANAPAAKKGVAAKISAQSRIRLLSQDTSSPHSSTLTFVDQSSSKKADTIEVEIVYTNSLSSSLPGLLDTVDVIIKDSPKTQPALSGKSNNRSVGLVFMSDSTKLENHSPDQDSVKIMPSFMPESSKEIRRILKKLLGISSLEDQLSYLQKIYTKRHYTVEKTKEIGWFFVSEDERLLFFRLIVQLISDVENVDELQRVFLKEGSIKKFKENISAHF